MSGKRSGISLDMTAMCDVAFLLLTFFILTAKMKTPEIVQVDIPSSVSEKKVPEQNLIKITVSNEGAVYFSVSESSTRRQIIERVAEQRQLTLSENEKNIFSNIEMMGMPINQLKGFLSLSPEAREEYKQPGIPIDSLDNQLKIWIREAKFANNSMIIAIKGDRDSDYEKYNGVVATLQELKLNKFSLITSLEGKPE